MMIMQRRRWIAWTLLGAAVLAAAGLWFWNTRRGPRWNVLIITLGSTRADHIGCYGHAAALTPAIDGLAGRGVLFERASATAPMTLPSHATMFTGLQPPEHGLVTNGMGRLPEELSTLAEILSARGWSTAAFVAAFVLDSKFGLDQGFETYNDDLRGTPRPADLLHRERPGNVVVDAAIDWLSAHKHKRFHCWIHLYDPHLPYVPHTDEFGDRFADAPYDAEIAFADRQVARVLDFLEREGLSERTLVVLAGDHGEGLDEHGEQGHGYLLYQSTLHVPLVIAGPLPEARGVRVPEPVSLVDLFPTVLELLKISPPARHSGQSLAGVWRGEPVAPRECFAMTDEPLLDNGWAPLRSLTTSDWKYIRTPRVELYDLRDDPAETTNLAGERPELLADLENTLAALESRMQVREAVAARRTAAEQRTLASLGSNGGLADQRPAGDRDLPDVKDKLPLYNRLSEAVHLLEQDRAEEAEPILREVVAADPEFRKALGNLGFCLARLGRLDEAIQQYQRVLELDTADASVLVNLAAAYAAQGKTDEAIRHYEAAIAADRHSPVAAYQLGLLSLELKDVRQAESLFVQALERDPTFDPALRAQADLAAQRGDIQMAVARYRAALEANPQSVPTLVNFGILAARMGDLDTAESRLLEAIRVDPGNPQPRHNLGRVYLMRGRPEDTLAQLKAVLAEHPDYIPTIMALGWLLAAHPDDRVRDAEQALELSERAVALSNRQSIDAFDLLGAALAEAGRFGEARAAVDEALHLAAAQPGYPVRKLQERREMYVNGQRYRTTEL